MSRIAISYRRADTAGYAGRLYDSLSAHFGAQNVFLDISGLEPGVDFVDAIQRAVASCDAMLVLIGPQWLTAGDGHGRRLEDPEDFVRLEVGTALSRDIRVIPVLVQGASMPGPDQLPDALAKLTRRQAFELSDGRWQYDLGRLVETLERVLAPGDATFRPAAPPGPAATTAAPAPETARQRAGGAPRDRSETATRGTAPADTAVPNAPESHPAATPSVGYLLGRLVRGRITGEQFLRQLIRGRMSRRKLVAAGLFGGLFAAIAVIVLIATQPVADVGDAFMAALKNGDDERAYSLTSPDLQKQLGSSAGLARSLIVDNIRPVSWSFSGRSISGTSGRLDGSVTLANRQTKGLYLSFVNVGNSWKISDVVMK